MLPVYLDITDKAKRKINENIWSMFDFLKSVCENLSYEEVLDGIFPKHILDVELEKCVSTIKELSNMTIDGYKREYLLPFYEWALFHTIKWWIDVADDIELDEIPQEDCVNNDGLSMYDYLNDVEKYLDFMFADWDFLCVEEFYEMYMWNSEMLDDFFHIDVSKYAELMPRDIRQVIEKSNKNLEKETTFDQESYVIQSIYNYLQIESVRTAKYLERGEVKINEVDLSDAIKNGLLQLFEEHNMTIEREARGGYALEDLGELDFYIYSIDNGIYHKIAVGENKKWGEYRNSIGQLLGYMDNDTKFGFTIIFNQDTYLETVLKGRKKILQEFNIDGYFKVVGEIEELENMNDVLKTKHENPEKPESYFNLYHFIFNVHKPVRSKSAKVSRKRGKDK